MAEKQNLPVVAEKAAPIRLCRAYWDEAGDRHDPGAVVSVTVAEARRLMAAGIGDRADPLPGEN